MAARHLQGTMVDGAMPDECKESLEFEGATTVAQIFQGVAFLALAVFLIFANNAKIGGGLRAPLETRYQTSLTIATAVCLFSGFFNILQMTGLDDFDLPRSTTFTLDLSRPVEWILTCPVMQLILVILGGARLPSYRKFMMPMLTAANLLCGVAAMFSEAGGMQWAWFIFGFTLWCIYTYYNIQQIKENSDGDEGLFHGESDYRMISVITIFTWFPFPCWFIVSPEGLGLISDVSTVQLGWAILNIISKFSFILHLQHIKTKYCRTLEATRELYGVQPGHSVPLPDGKTVKKSKEEDDVQEDGGEEKIITLIKETMVSLNMSSHSERFLKLMLDNGIVSTDILERLTAERAMDLNLPWSLCEAVQKRWKAEKLNLGQDRGGLIEKEDPFKKLLAEGKARRQGPACVLPGQMDGAMIEQLMAQAQSNGNGMTTPPLAMFQASPANEQRMSQMETNIANIMEALQGLHTLQGTMQIICEKVEKFDNSQEAICQRLDFAQQAQLQTLNSSQVLLHKVDSSQEDVLHKMVAQKELLNGIKGGQDSIVDALSGANNENRQALLDSVNNSSKVLLTKLDTSQQELLQKQDVAKELLGKISGSQEKMAQQVGAGNEAASRRAVEAEASLDAKMQDLTTEVVKTCTDSSNQISKTIEKEMSSMSRQSTVTINSLDQGMATQDEHIGELRRQNMMIMDMLSGTQERVVQSADAIATFTRDNLVHNDNAKLEVEIRGAISQEIDRLTSHLHETLLGSDEMPGGFLGALAQRQHMEGGASQGSTSGIEEVVRRELSAVALALSQQQREMSEQQVGQVGQTVRSELRGTSEQLQAQVERFEGALDEGMTRFEQGVQKVIAEKGEKSEKTDKESRRQNRADRADRG